MVSSKNNTPIIELWRKPSAATCLTDSGQLARFRFSTSAPPRRDWMSSHPNLLHGELVKMYRCLFKPELISPNEAVGEFPITIK
jgi:hypothetical protein